MNIFLYGMQSSGASLITYFMGQLPRSVVIVDVWNNTLVPPLREAKSNTEHVIAKCVITTEYSLDDHVESFHPDLKILVLRHPLHNYVSLMRKSYEKGGGDIDDKFRRLEDLFVNRDQFDGVLMYEDFVLRPTATISTLQGMGVAVKEEFLRFGRSREEMIRFNCEHSTWCRDHWHKKWGFGNLKADALSPHYLFKYIPRDIESRVQSLCPQVCAFMDQYYAAHVSYFTRLRGSWWHDGVIRKAQRIKKRFQQGPSGAL